MGYKISKSFKEEGVEKIAISTTEWGQKLWDSEEKKWVERKTFEVVKKEEIYLKIKEREPINLAGKYVKGLSLDEYREKEGLGKKEKVILKDFNAAGAFFDGEINLSYVIFEGKILFDLKDKEDIMIGDLKAAGSFSGKGICLSYEAFKVDLPFKNGIKRKQKPSVKTEGSVSFEGSIFLKGSVSFENTNFGNGVSFAVANFENGYVSFKKANFEDGGVSFVHAKFGDISVSFEVATFGNGDVSFKNAILGKGSISFKQATFGKGNINFEHVNFEEGSAIFFLTNFGDGDISFRDATLRSGTFSNVTFGKGNINFENITLKGNSLFFEDLTFGKGNVSFKNSTLGKNDFIFCDASFGEGDVSFEDVDFGDGFVVFFQTSFEKGEVSFERANFGNEVFFGDTNFGDGNISFKEATFGGGGASFKGATFGKGNVAFKGIKMEGDWDIRVKKADIIDFSDSKIYGNIDLGFYKDKKENECIPDVKELRLINTKLYGSIHMDYNALKISDAINIQKDTAHRQKRDQFRLLKENLRRLGQYDDEDEAYVQFRKHWLRDQTGWDEAKSIWEVIKKHPFYLFKLYLFEKIGLYGTSPVQVIKNMGLCIALFSFPYWALGNTEPLFLPEKMPVWMIKLFNGTYHSIITFLTIGYGDKYVYPSFWGRALSGIEGFAGLFLMSYFTIAFVRKVLR